MVLSDKNLYLYTVCTAQNKLILSFSVTARKVHRHYHSEVTTHSRQYVNVNFFSHNDP